MGTDDIGNVSLEGRRQIIVIIISTHIEHVLLYLYISSSNTYNLSCYNLSCMYLNNIVYYILRRLISTNFSSSEHV